jgi:ankyrin repeat protein
MTMQDNDGNTALQRASYWGYAETARILLEHGANIDHQNDVSI